MSDDNLPAEQPPEGDFLLYQTQDGQTPIECRFAGETIWLSQALMAEHFAQSLEELKQIEKRKKKGSSG